MASKSWRIRKKPTAAERGEFWCHFCGKSRDQVSKLVAADSGVCICDECVMLSLEIILEGEPGDVPGIEKITGGGLDRDGLRSKLDELENLVRDLRRDVG